MTTIATVQEAHEDLVRARAERHAAETRVQAADERLDAVLAANGWRRMSGLLNAEALYTGPDGEAYSLGGAMARLAVAA